MNWLGAACVAGAFATFLVSNTGGNDLNPGSCTLAAGLVVGGLVAFTRGARK